MSKIALMIGLLAVVLFSTTQARADFLLNGDFEQGNTGFQTQYTSLSGTAANPASSNPGQYEVTTNPIYVNPFWYAGFGDHTSGHGNMMLVDGSQNTSLYLWSETVSGLSVGTVYNFTLWAASVDVTNETPPATLMITAGGTRIGSLVIVPAASATWREFTQTFTAGASTITFQIFDQQTTHDYNDFALDDLSLAPASVPEPSSLLLLAAGAAALLGRGRRRK